MATSVQVDGSVFSEYTPSAPGTVNSVPDTVSCHGQIETCNVLSYGDMFAQDPLDPINYFIGRPTEEEEISCLEKCAMEANGIGITIDRCPPDEIKLLDGDRSSLSENKDISNFRVNIQQGFCENVDNCQNDNNRNNDYQFLELSSIQKDFKSPFICKSGDQIEKYLEVAEEGIVVAISDVKIHQLDGASIFCCCQCSSTFFDRQGVILHLASHVELKPFHCVFCKLSLLTEDEARLHYKSHGAGNRNAATNHSLNDLIEVKKTFNSCSFCDEVVDCAHTCLRHEQSHLITDSNASFHPDNYNENSLRVSQLASQGNSSEDISPQTKVYTGKDKKRERKWICETCHKAFRSSRALHEHEVVHTGARNHPCNICGKAFGTAANLRIHLSTHSDERPFTCLTCGASFRQKDSLKVHVRKHTGERPFVCNICKLAFDRSFTLKNHMLTHAGKSFVCSMCGKAFSTKGGLNNHERLHFKDTTSPRKERQPRAKAGSGNWVCDECGKIYSTRSNLKIHKKSHEPTQVSHVCPVCSQAYKSRDSMEVHMRRHTEERPFKCSMCSRSFYRNYTLKIHILTHTGEKPHCCPIEGCSKSFAQSSSLSYHIRNHKKREERNSIGGSGKRPYKRRKTSNETLPSHHTSNYHDDLIDRNHMKVSEISNVSGETHNLKLGAGPPMDQEIQGDIVNHSVQAMLDDISNNIPHHINNSQSIAVDWTESESVGILDVPSGLHDHHGHPSLGNHTIGVNLAESSCQEVPFMHYMPHESLTSLVGVSDNGIFQHHNIPKVLSDQTPLIPHLP